MKYTLSILKPDATIRNITGQVNSYIEKTGLKIVAQKMLHMTKEQAESFYAIHKTRPFFNDLVKYMISDLIVVQVLYGNDAVTIYRKIMGATNPFDAEMGTVRRDFGKNIVENTIHGSDSIETAKQEINFFFPSFILKE